MLSVEASQSHGGLGAGLQKNYQTNAFGKRKVGLLVILRDEVDPRGME
jgi:hypothetical protein